MRTGEFIKRAFDKKTKNETTEQEHQMSKRLSLVSVEVGDEMIRSMNLKELNTFHDLESTQKMIWQIEKQADGKDDELKLKEFEKTISSCKIKRILFGVQEFLKLHPLKYFMEEEINSALNIRRNNETDSWHDKIGSKETRLDIITEYTALHIILQALRDKKEGYGNKKEGRFFVYEKLGNNTWKYNLSAKKYPNSVWKYCYMDYDYFLTIEKKIREIVKLTPNKRFSREDLASATKIIPGEIVIVDKVINSFADKLNGFETEEQHGIIYCYYVDLNAAEREKRERMEKERNEFDAWRKKEEARKTSEKEKNGKERERTENKDWDEIKTKEEFYISLHRRLVDRFYPKIASDPDWSQKIEISREINTCHQARDLEGLKSVAKKYAPDWKTHLNKF